MGAFQLAAVRHHVAHGSGGQFAHVADNPVPLCQLGDVWLHQAQEFAAGSQGIDPLFRKGRVGRLADEFHVEFLGHAEKHARTAGDRSQRQSAGHVQREGFLHVEALDQALRDHALRAAFALFSRLEEKEQIALHLLCRHLRDQAQQHRHVDIVAAGVHQAWVLGGKSAAGVFANRQGVHVRAEKPVGTFTTAVFHQDAGVGGEFVDPEVGDAM